MTKGGSDAKTVLFVSSVSALYGAERSLLEIVDVMGPAWRPWFVVPVKGRYSAALDDANLASIRRYLTDLYDAYLLAEPVRGRYRMHDLIAERARTLAATDGVAVREAAVERLMSYYLHTSRIASRQYARRSPSGDSANANATTAPATCTPSGTSTTT